MAQKTNITPHCTVCSRFHDINQPCPMRIANAYLKKLGALGKLTGADEEWIDTHSDPDILKILEEALADMM